MQQTIAQNHLAAGWQQSVDAIKAEFEKTELQKMLEEMGCIVIPAKDLPQVLSEVL